VILISHNMADVQAVADRIVVLRLGRNAAEFKVAEAEHRAAGRRHHRRVRQRGRGPRGAGRGQEPPMADVQDVELPDAAPRVCPPTCSTSG
jgi:ABC-type sugar transport system ATPase subunit